MKILDKVEELIEEARLQEFLCKPKNRPKLAIS